MGSDPLNGYASDIALGDVDGNLDALIGKYGKEESLLTNLTRALAWRGIPRIGKPLTYDLYGPPSGVWFLGVSLGTAGIPIPPLGTFRLDPASSSAFPSGRSTRRDGLRSLSPCRRTPPFPGSRSTAKRWSPSPRSSRTSRSRR